MHNTRYTSIHIQAHDIRIQAYALAHTHTRTHTHSHTYIPGTTCTFNMYTQVACLPRRDMLAAGLLAGLAAPEFSLAETSTSPVSSQGEAFEDDEYTLFAPGGFNYVEMAIPKKEVGPAPGVEEAALKD